MRDDADAMANQPLTGADADAQPGTSGIWTFVFIDMIVFTLIFLVFISEKWRLPNVFSEGQAHLDFRFGLVNTLLLLTSSLFMVEGVHAARAGSLIGVRRNLALGLICGAAFCVAKTFEYHAKLVAGLTPATSSFFSLYYFITGAHLLHMIGIMVFAVNCLVAAPRELGQTSYRKKIENTGLFWHFVDLLWLFIFPLLYLAKGA